MLPFFCEPYPDELIYSAVARYHYYSGNRHFRDTLQDIYGIQTVIPSLEIGSRMDLLSSAIGPKFSPEYLVSRHTVYPYYDPFLSEKRKEDLWKDIRETGNALYSRIGKSAGGICKRNGIWYCSSCAQEEMIRYGECYFHREHQLQGIAFCHRHEVPLTRYPVDPKEQSRIGFIRMDHNMISKLMRRPSDNRFDQLQIELAQMAYQLLQIPPGKYDHQTVRLRYRQLLFEKDLVTGAGRIRQKELHDAVRAYFSDQILTTLESPLISEEESWLSAVVRKPRKSIHPLRHLLLIHFLTGADVEDFFAISDQEISPFGRGPWPCLNKASNHYHLPVVEQVTIKRDCDSGKPVGVFRCSCGFAYSRRGPDRDEADRFRAGRIQEFGPVWTARLRELNKPGTLSLREKARILGVDPKTVTKYSIPEQETGIPVLPQQNTDVPKTVTPCKTLEVQDEEHIDSTTHGEDRSLLQRELAGTDSAVQRGTRHEVDWAARDLKYIEEAKRIHETLLRAEKTTRLSRSAFLRRMGSTAETALKKGLLPLTQKYLTRVTETVKDYQLRRCQRIIDQMIQEKDVVRVWKVQRKAGIRSAAFQKLRPLLEQYIENKMEESRIVKSTGKRPMAI